MTVVTEKDVDLVRMIEEEVGVKMVELDLPEEQVLEGLNTVSVARRMATMVSSLAEECSGQVLKPSSGDARHWLWGEASYEQGQSFTEREAQQGKHRRRLRVCR